MNDLRQAAQALLNRWDSPLWKNSSTADAIADLRTALEQQQAKPVAAESITDAMMNLVDRLGSEWKQVDLRAWQHLLVYAPQQQAEPVAWTTMPEAEDWCFVSGGKDPTSKLEGKWFPLYTTPPQRKELSASEILNMMPSTIPAAYDGELMEFARAVEAKTKEGT